MTGFSKKEALRFGWAGMKSHFWFFVAVLLIAFIVQSAPNFISRSLTGNSFVFLIIVVISIAGWFLKMIIDLGFIRIGLSVVDNKAVQVSSLFGEYKLWWRYFRAQVLSGLITLFGFILLIVPGIIWSTRLQYFGYFIVDLRLGPVAALQESWKITRGNVWNLLLFSLLQGLVNILGALALVIGLFATIPTTMIAQAYVFRKLQGGNINDQTISAGKLYAMVIAGMILVLVVGVGLMAIVILALSRLFQGSNISY